MAKRSIKQVINLELTKPLTHIRRGSRSCPEETASGKGAKWERMAGSQGHPVSHNVRTRLLSLVITPNRHGPVSLQLP